jgi:hypothetical protein
MIYLDSAAVVKLAHAELETAALRRWLDQRAETGWISSVLTEIESLRALARYAPAAVSRLPPVLDQIELINLDLRIRAWPRRLTRSRCAAWMPFISAQPCARLPLKRRS